MYKLSFDKFYILLKKYNYAVIKVFYDIQNNIKYVGYIHCISGVNKRSIFIEIPIQYKMLLPINTVDIIEIFEISNQNCLCHSSIKYTDTITSKIHEQNISYVFVTKDSMCVQNNDNIKCYEINFEFQSDGNIHSLESELHTIRHNIEDNEYIINEEQFTNEDNNDKTILIFKNNKDYKKKQININNSDVYVCMNVKLFYKNVKTLENDYQHVFDKIEYNKSVIRKSRLDKIKLSLNNKIITLEKKYNVFLDKEKDFKTQLLRLNTILKDCDGIKNNEDISALYTKTEKTINNARNQLTELYKEMNNFINNHEKWTH